MAYPIQTLKWGSVDGEIYDTEQQARFADSIHYQKIKIKQKLLDFTDNAQMAHFIYANWEELAKIMEEHIDG